MYRYTCARSLPADRSAVPTAGGVLDIHRYGALVPKDPAVVGTTVTSTRTDRATSEASIPNHQKKNKEGVEAIYLAV